MAATYPANIKNFGIPKVDFTDVVFAAHVNDLQDEVVAVQTALGNLPATSSGWIGTFDSATTSWATVKARINNIEYGLKDVYDKVGGSNISVNVSTFLATPSSANLAAAVSDETGTGLLVFNTSPVIVTPTLTLASTTSTSEGRIAWDGTNDQLRIGDGSATRTISPDDKAATLTNKTINGSNNTITNVSLTTGVTGTLPVANGGTGITSFGSGVATFLGTPSSANFASAVTDETGSGALVFGTSPSLSYPILISPEERWTTTATSATGTINYDVLTSSIIYYTSNASANFTLNFRGNSGTTLNSILAVGDSVTVVFANTNGATAYYPTAFQIDGSSVTPKWAGGTAPSAGSASAIDSYTFTIVKTAATPTYVVFGSSTKFA